MRKTKKALALSGTSTKLPFTAGALKRLIEDGNQFDLIVGTSGGSIAGFMYAIGATDYLFKKSVDYSLSELFGENIKSRFGRVRAILRYLFKGHLYNFDGLHNLLDTPEVYQLYKQWSTSQDGPRMFAHCYNEDEAQSVFIDLKKVGYEKALKAIVASCSIPVAVPPVNIDGVDLFDGGYDSHIGSEWLVSKYGFKMESLVSIYSRVQDIREYKKDLKPSSKLERAERILETKIIKESHRAEMSTRKLCKYKRIKDTYIFAPQILQRSLYQSNKKENEKLFKLGYEHAKK